MGTVVATDPDADNHVTFTLSGTDADLFAITTSGALSFSSAPNLESPKGGENDDSNSYTVTVTATGGAGDRALTASQDLTITVTDATEVSGLPSIHVSSYDDAGNDGSLRIVLGDDGGSSVLELSVGWVSFDERDDGDRRVSSGVTTVNSPGRTVSVDFTRPNIGTINYWEFTARARNAVGWGPVRTVRFDDP